MLHTRSTQRIQNVLNSIKRISNKICLSHCVDRHCVCHKTYGFVVRLPRFVEPNPKSDVIHFFSSCSLSHTHTHTSSMFVFLHNQMPTRLIWTHLNWVSIQKTGAHQNITLEHTLLFFYLRCILVLIVWANLYDKNTMVLHQCIAATVWKNSSRNKR